MRLLIKQVRVIDPRSAYHQQIVDLFIEDGQVREIGNGLQQTADVFLDQPDMHISPGFVDLFVDFCEPGLEHKETLETGLQAAAAGGYSHICLLPNLLPATDQKSAVKGLLKAAYGQVTQVHPLGAISQKLEGKSLAEMLDMYDGGAIAFTDGWVPLQQSNLFLKALEYIKSFEGLIIQIPLETSLSKGGQMHEGEVSTQMGMPGIPEIAETIAIDQAIQLLRYTGSNLHLTGISSAASVEQIRMAKAEGLNISCSVTPYHLCLNDEILRSYNSLYKVMPPIRTEEDRLALIAGLKDGTIDAITAHHRPQDWDGKHKEFDYAEAGMNVLQYCFCLAYDVLKYSLPLERIIDAMSIRPRQLLHLPETVMQPGTLADFVIYSLNKTTTIVESENLSLSHNNPFFGSEKAGKVMATIRENSIEMTKLPQ